MNPDHSLRTYTATVANDMHAASSAGLLAIIRGAEITSPIVQMHVFVDVTLAEEMNRIAAARPGIHFVMLPPGGAEYTFEAILQRERERRLRAQ